MFCFNSPSKTFASRHTYWSDVSLDVDSGYGVRWVILVQSNHLLYIQLCQAGSCPCSLHGNKLRRFSQSIHDYQNTIIPIPRTRQTIHEVHRDTIPLPLENTKRL